MRLSLWSLVCFAVLGTEYYNLRLYFAKCARGGATHNREVVSDFSRHDKCGYMEVCVCVFVGFYVCVCAPIRIYLNLVYVC